MKKIILFLTLLSCITLNAQTDTTKFVDNVWLIHNGEDLQIKCKIVSITKDTMQIITVFNRHKAINMGNVEDYEWNSIKGSNIAYKAGLYLKQSNDLEIAALVIAGVGVTVGFAIISPPVIIVSAVVAGVVGVISIIKERKAAKELMLINLK